MEIQSFLADGGCRQDVRPKGRVEASANFIGSSWSSLHYAAFHFDGRLGLGIPERYGDVAAHWYLMRLTTNSVETEATGAQSER